MLNISELINDPDFAQPTGFTVTRSTGAWVAGVFTVTTEQLAYTGTIIPATTKEIEMLPEADRVHGAVSVWTLAPLYVTRLDNTNTGEDGGLSDEITWDGKQWKIMQVRGFQDYGYYKGIAIRKDAA